MPEYNRRQDFRIDDVLAMRDQMISEIEFETLKKQPGIRSRQNAMLQDMVGKDIFSGDLKDGINHDVANALETLDTKLNYLIGVNMLNDANRSDLKERPVNLSVTGTSFYTETRYRKGDYIQITMMLPSFPPSILELVGKITWVKPSNQNTQHIGIRFSYRCDEEERSIAKYVFLRHRESIRLKVKESAEN